MTVMYITTTSSDVGWFWYGVQGFPRSDSDYDLAQCSALQLRSDYLLSISKGLGYLILWIFTFDLLVTSHKILRP